MGKNYFLFVILFAFSLTAQVNYKTIENKVEMRAIDFSDETLVYHDTNYTKNFPFINIGGGNWVAGINTSIVDLDFKLNLGAGIYYKVKKTRGTKIKDVTFKASYKTKQPLSSDFVLGQEVELTPLDRKITKVESVDLEFGAPEIEIGIYIDAGAAMRLEGSGVDLNLFSVPSNFANNSNPETIQIPLFVIKEGGLSLPVDIPEPLKLAITEYLASKDIYYGLDNYTGIKSKGFRFNVPSLGMRLNYSAPSEKYFNQRVLEFFDNYGLELDTVGDDAMFIAALNDKLNFSLDLTQFLDYFAERALKDCLKCAKLKLLKALILKIENKNVILGNLSHYGLQVNGAIGLSLQNRITVTPDFLVDYHIEKDGNTVVPPHKVVKANNETQVVLDNTTTYQDFGSIKVGFDEKAIIYYPIEFQDAIDIKINSVLSIKKLNLEQTHSIKEKHSAYYKIFYGKFIPSKTANSVIQTVSLGTVSVPDINYGPVFEGNILNGSSSTSNFSSFNYERNESIVSNGGYNTVGSLTPNSVFFTGNIPNVVLVEGEQINVANLYLGDIEGYTFSPEFISEIGAHTVNVQGDVNHSFTIDVIQNTPPVVKPGYEPSYVNLMGGVDASGEMKYAELNATDLNYATDDMGNELTCSFVYTNVINELKSQLQGAGIGIDTNITISLLAEDNASLNLNNLPYGKHEIVYRASDEKGNLGKYVRYIDIINNNPIEFTLKEPSISKMLNDNGKLKLVIDIESTGGVSDDGYNLIEVLYELKTPEYTCGEGFKMSLSQSEFNCSTLGEHTVTVTLSKEGYSYSQDLTLTVLNNPNLEFHNNTMYINKYATGEETGKDMENGFKDLDQALNLLPCRIENVENVYIKHGDYYAYSTDADYSNYDASYNYSAFNKIKVKQDLNFESIEGVSTFKFSNFFVEAGVTATFTNINFENSTIIADKNSKVILKNCAFETNQFAIVSIGTVEAYNTTFVNSQGGYVSYEGPNASHTAFDPLFEIKDPEGKCEFTNAYGDTMVSQDVGLFYLFGGEEGSKFINCSFNNNTVVFDGTPGGMFCSTNVEFSNCIFDTTVATQFREGQLFGIGEDVTLTLKNNLINVLDRDESLPTAEESICNDPNIICSNNQFFVTPDTEPNYFPGPNYFSYVDPYGDDSDGNPYNYNLRLKEGSIAIDAGDDSLYPSEINLTTDLGGANRFCGSSIDVGAFEYSNCGTLGNADVTKDGKFIFYPIPSKDYVFIKGGTKEEKTYYVFDNYGNLVKKGQCINQIDVSTLSTGLYFIKIEIGNSAITQKIIKK